jgi:hypothetical protein
MREIGTSRFIRGGRDKRPTYSAADAVPYRKMRGNRIKSHAKVLIQFGTAFRARGQVPSTGLGNTCHLNYTPSN